MKERNNESQVGLKITTKRSELIESVSVSYE